MINNHSTFSQENDRYPNTINVFSIDSEGRVYSANNDFFAVIEYATDIKLKGKKPARLYHENKGYLGQNEQWVKDKDQAILFETKRELTNWLNAYFAPENDSQISLFNLFTVSNESENEVINDNKPSENTTNSNECEIVNGDSCLISEKDYYERVLNEFRSSGIPDEVTFCSVKIYPPSKG